jgi:hypothetical protein
MNHMKMNLPLILIALTVILIPSIASVSSSQSNDTLSDEAFVDDTLSNDTFSSLSRDFANNQTRSDDDSDQEADD